MKIVYLSRRVVRVFCPDHPLYGTKQELLTVVAKPGLPLEVDDDIVAPLGWVWNGDSDQPKFHRAMEIQ